MINDHGAAQKWETLPQDLRKQLLNYVLCSDCGFTAVIDYTLHDDEFGIQIEGKCKNCGNDVSRLVEIICPIPDNAEMPI